MRANRHASSKRCAWKKCSERSSASDSGWSPSAGDDRLAGAGVQLAAAPERQLLVRGVAEHRVAEAHDVAGDEAEEAVEAAPGRLVRDAAARRRSPRSSSSTRNVWPSTDGVAEQPALDGREPVDLRGDHRVDGVGERVDVAARDRGLAAARRGTAGCPAARSASVATSCGRSGESSVAAMSAAAACSASAARGAACARGGAPARGTRSRRCGGSRRCSVGRVAEVLDDDLRAPRTTPRPSSGRPRGSRAPRSGSARSRKIAMTSCTRSRRNSGASAAVSAVSGRSRSSGVRAAGATGAARGTGARPSPRSRSAISSGAGGLGQPEHVVEQPPERRVRRGGLVRVARDRERGHVAGEPAQLLDQPALADARVADELDRRARARRAAPRGPR